jgi:RNA-directed DNA polymerase
MRTTGPQQYKAAGLENEVDPDVLDNAVAAIERIRAVNPKLFPLLTLNHLSAETGLTYGYLRLAVARVSGKYKHIMLKKRVPGRSSHRMISIPSGRLMTCQRWIASNILRHAQPHSRSFAYHPDSNPVFAAREHTEAKWLIKVDIQDFFHAITEHQVYRVFRSLGYSRLLSFELSRLCTMACKRLPADNAHLKYEGSEIEAYQSPYIGILPQGAPTSPMLSNLAVKSLDETLAKLATDNDMRFTRYADDIVFSCKDERDRKSVNRVKRAILRSLNEEGFRPNLRKTAIRGPGSRKVVLGILVDCKKPRLAREYKDKIRQHLHYLSHPNFGPSKHASARKTSVSQIYHHVFGLICWAKAVDPEFGKEALAKFNAVDWPPIAKPTYYH